MKQLIALAVVCTILSLSGAAVALEQGKLTVWISPDKGYKGLTQVAERFTADTGVPVRVAHHDNLERRFQRAASNAQGPDILIYSHDRFGDWADGRLISALNPSAEVKARFDDIAWEAVTIDGSIYGYPVAVEAVSLIYNKDLMPEGPARTFEEMPHLNTELQKAGKHAILWDYETPYFTYPLLSANGGYTFGKRPDGSYDVRDTGVNNAGSRQGVAFLAEMIAKGQLPRGLDYGTAESGFLDGEAAMTINGPWAWDKLDKSGIKYGLAPLPSLGGNPARAFVGVLAGAINNASPNKELATRFLEHYLLTPEGLRMVNDDRPLGAVALKALQVPLAEDERIRVTLENARNGEPIPSVPEMVDYWTALEGALRNITLGRQGVDEALDAAAQRILGGDSR